MRYDDLADDELRARLTQHGLPDDDAADLVRRRDDPDATREIVAVLEWHG